MPNFGGKQYRTHGQAYRASQESPKEPSQDAADNQKGGDAVNDQNSPKGKHVVMIKHSGTPEAPAPPFHVKHADGTVHGPMNSSEELMSHMSQHMGGGEEEDLGHDQNHEALENISDGSKEAIESLLG
jgi:hypothetical protein